MDKDCVIICMKNLTERAKTIDEIVAESNVSHWTDADSERASEMDKGLFDGFAGQVRKWRDQDEALDAGRQARLEPYFTQPKTF